MSKKNDDFFKQKKDWSEVKDQLLGCYFKPYIQKVLHTRKPIAYVDCFAGKGKFEDGNPGSPIIALDTINECVSKTTMASSYIETTFIDLNYGEDLKKNLSGYPRVNIISGRFEDNIDGILQNKNGYNVFLYIDPYGIKALNCAMFDRFANNGFYSIELLINMNSFGFIREACHAMGTTFSIDDKAIFDDLVEYDPTELSASDKSVLELDEIAGGTYWHTIIKDYNDKKIDGYEAEERFARQYCQRLMKSYKYVLNMPLRIKRGQRPKYRMIHATNHPDGCLLMVDNICNRWQALQDIQNQGQLSFFEEDINNNAVDMVDLEQKAITYFSKYKTYISLNMALSQFFVEFGPICKKHYIIDILNGFEKDYKIEIQRTPQLTATGKPTKFMEENSKQKVWIRWR